MSEKISAEKNEGEWEAFKKYLDTLRAQAGESCVARERGKQAVAA